MKNAYCQGAVMQSCCMYFSLESFINMVNLFGAQRQTVCEREGGDERLSEKGRERERDRQTAVEPVKARKAVTATGSKETASCSSD